MFSFYASCCIFFVCVPLSWKHLLHVAMLSKLSYIEKGTCLKGGSSSNNGIQQHNVNWEHNEVLVFIKCKHAEYARETKIMDARASMIPTKQ